MNLFPELLVPFITTVLFVRLYLFFVFICYLLTKSIGVLKRIVPETLPNNSS